MKDKVLNIVTILLPVILIALIAFMIHQRSTVKDQLEQSIGENVSDSGWDPDSNELYVTEDHSEFESVYQDLGGSDELIAVNEIITIDGLTASHWFVDIDGVEYELSFSDDGKMSITGDDTTTSGVYVCEYRSDAPQFIYLTISSQYVNIEGFVGYNEDYVYLYSNAEDEMQTPPMYDYYLLRRNINA